MLEGAKEWLGQTLGKLPFVGNTVGSAIDSEYNEHKYGKSFFTSAVGVVGGGLLGWKLGSNFGTLGSLATGVAFAVVGPKLTKEIGSDFGAAKDYCQDNKNASFLKTFGANLLDISGQKYDGTLNGAEPDV